METEVKCFQAGEPQAATSSQHIHKSRQMNGTKDCDPTQNFDIVDLEKIASNTMQVGEPRIHIHP